MSIPPESWSPWPSTPPSAPPASAPFDAAGMDEASDATMAPRGDAPTQRMWQSSPPEIHPDVYVATDDDAPTISTRAASEKGYARPGALYAPYKGPLSDRSRQIRLLLILGAAVALVSLVIALVAAQVFSAAFGGPSRAQTSAPVQAHATATATVSPTATATPATVAAASFVRLDTTTQGSWLGVYGGQGYSVVADTQNLPSTIQVTPSSEAEYTWAGSSTDPRAVQKAPNPADRVAACWYSPSSFTIDVNITDGQTHQLALYLLDWDSQNRAENVTALDPVTNAVLDTQNVATFASGEYLVWNVSGHITLRITNGPGSINAVVSGIFFAGA